MRHFLLKRGNRLEAARWESPFGEVDLLFRTKAGVLLLAEVKTLAPGQEIAGRLHGRQIQRLRRIVQYLSGFEECLAYVFFVRPGEDYRGEHLAGEIFWLPLADF